ncbi:MAG: ABC transporter ATP-binding protein [Muribaculaceae bacterium]|nr:ABC transporter ATP-binding protein [Muribaculaceae bacterium]
MSIITLEGISKVYQTKEIETTALENINLSVYKGEFVSVMGQSGCGKSTLLNIIGLLDRPTSGTVTLLDQNCNALGDTALSHFRNRNLGFVFQSFHLIPSLNVEANVELPLDYASGISGVERRRRVDEVLERLGLSHRKKHMPAQLSGGQCQRVAIARAIVGRPSIVLADEPTGNLDSRMGAEVMDLLHSLNKDDGITIVMVTHNEAQARQTDRIIRFFDGRIIS